MSIPISGPIVFLRCRKCGRKTDHVLIIIDCSSEKGEIGETYECQECGETRKIYELAATSHLRRLVQHSIENKVKEPQRKEPMK